MLNFRRGLRLSERLHPARTGGTIDSVANFDNWTQSHLALVTARATDLNIGWAGVLLGVLRLPSTMTR